MRAADAQIWQAMKKPLLLAAPLFASLALWGCGSASDSPTAPPEGEAAASAPTGEAKLTGDLEVAAFKGGYGIDFYESAAKDLETQNPGFTPKVWGDPHIWEKLRPRLVAGDPPDLMYPGWGMDHWALAEEGQLLLLDKALDSPPYGGGSGTWRDTFEPSVLKLGQKEGKQYVMPYFFSVWGWWYDPGVFEKNGWKVPTTYEELLDLGPKIKAKGIAPITFQGKYPYYMLQGMVFPWVQDIGGIEAMNAVQNLEPGAWKSPAMLEAVKRIAELRDKGFFQTGAVGLSHTESQTEFLNGHAAMIPCGTWLDSEMRNVKPKDAQMRYFQPPAIKGKGDASAVVIEIEPWMVPSAAKHADAAVAYYKYLTSLDQAKKFVAEKGTLTAVKGSDETKLPDSLVEPAKAFKASKVVWSYTARQWYPTLEKEVENALTSLLNGEATPEQFCDRAEAAATKVREDSSIPKHKVE